MAQTCQSVAHFKQRLAACAAHTLTPATIKLSLASASGNASCGTRRSCSRRVSGIHRASSVAASWLSPRRTHRGTPPGARRTGKGGKDVRLARDRLFAAAVQQHERLPVLKGAVRVAKRKDHKRQLQLAQHVLACRGTRWSISREFPGVSNAEPMPLHS